MLKLKLKTQKQCPGLEKPTHEGIKIYELMAHEKQDFSVLQAPSELC